MTACASKTDVASPPCFGLRDYGVAGQMGLKRSPVVYVEPMVGVFRAVREVLAAEGTVWLNLRDSYAMRGGALTRRPKWATLSGVVSAEEW
jgi:hypothetical protein